MLYYLANEFREQIGFLNLFTYVTSRAVFAALTSLLIGLIVYPLFIRWQKNLEVGESIRDDGPQTHLEKVGTPTMGGIIILLALAFSTILWGDLTNAFILILLLTILLFGAIGFVDDWRKLIYKNSKGLSARLKMIFQTIAALIILYCLWKFTYVNEHVGILIPYWKDLILPFGVIGFFIVGWLCIVGSSNAVNLTDGLDGLAILPSVMICSGLAVFAYVAGHNVFSEYLGLPNILGVQEVVIFCAGFCGAGLAFLWYNASPAQVFMGDTGSIAIGAALATIAVAIRQEIIFAIMAGLFVLEAVSVILQVSSFRLTGKRIFRMAPLHHHFEQKGWPENVVVVRFWIVTIILVLCALASLKIR